MRRPFFLGAAAFLGFIAGAGCRSCEKIERERPARFVQKSAEAVVELKDLGVLVKSKSKLKEAIARVIPAEQLDAIEKEAALAFGFDPATDQGLEDAGLPKEGAIAAEIASGGQGALWIVPAKDEKKLEKTIDHIVRVRASVEAAEKAQIGGKEATVLTGSFGPEKIVVAAFTFDRGHALIGAGPKAKELLERALATAKDPEGSIEKNEEYAALDRALGREADVRIIVPHVAETAAGALSAVSRIGGPNLDEAAAMLPHIKGVKSAGWSIHFRDRGARIDGRIRLDAAALADARAMFGKASPPPPLVRKLDLEDAVIFGYASVDPKILYGMLTAAASPAMKAELDRILLRAKEETGIDIEKDALPLLSGQGGLALGISGLEGTDIRTLVERPANYLWSATAVGVSDPRRLLDIEKRADAWLEAHDVRADARKSGSTEVRVMRAKSSDLVLSESAPGEGAYLFTNGSSITDRLLGAPEPKTSPPLGGKAGILIELRCTALGKALDQLNLYTLPVLYRAIATKLVSTIHAVDKTSLSFLPADDGLAIEARIQLAPP